MPYPSIWSSWTTTSATTCDVWDYWTGGTDATGTDWNDVWLRWTTTTSDTATTFHPAWITWTQQVTALQETKRQRDARIKREARQRAARQAEIDASLAAFREAEIERAAERAEAAAKATALLKENLSEEQVKSFDELQAFLVTAQSGDTYRIRKGRSGNVELLNDEGVAVARYCIHPQEMVPDEDTMLAQKLLLETNEKAFKRIANKTVIPFPRRVAA